MDNLLITSINDPINADVKKAFLAAIEAGTAVCTCGPLYVEWTEEDVKRLDEALKRCFQIESSPGDFTHYD